MAFVLDIPHYLTQPGFIDLFGVPRGDMDLEPWNENCGVEIVRIFADRYGRE
jgi:hypothetical protein